MQEQLIKRALELLENGTVDRVMGWKATDVCYEVTPAVFTDAKELKEQFVYNDFCGANLSKSLIAESRKEGKILAFLKPCDTYSYNQLVKEHRIRADAVYVIGIGCRGTCRPESLRRAVDSAVLAVSDGPTDGTLTVKTLDSTVSLEKKDLFDVRCRTCHSKKHVCGEEFIGEVDAVPVADRFADVAKLEGMTAEERFAFWRGELSRCIRCNACRNACPACTCENCVFDNAASGAANKSPANDFEENLFHIIRAYHVAGRCTDCGECSRVCPEQIPLHLLNRKFIKDINELYGPYQAGEDTVSRTPLTDYTKDDPEPDIVMKRGKA